MIAPKPSPAFPSGRLSGWARLTFWLQHRSLRLLWDVAMLAVLIYMAVVVSRHGREVDALEDALHDGPRYLKTAGD